VAAVIGDPVAHSLSPTIHNAAFAATGLDWIFVALPVPAGATDIALAGARALGIAGLSVTTPHKDAAGTAVDRCDGDAARLDAVNCVVREGSLLVGHNTDGPGFVDSLRDDEGLDPAGHRALVLGAGGAARAVVLALASAGAAEVVVVNRTGSRAEAAAALAGGAGRVGTAADVATADLVVNATSVGMGADPGSGVSPVDPSRLVAGQVVVDLVYEPAVTPLLVAAERRGARAVGGVGMLVHQAARAFTRWTGHEAPVAAMAAAARDELARRAGSTPSH
jgi:shikimate dehydrogenase